jgi:hypothetical protein
LRNTTSGAGRMNVGYEPTVTRSCHRQRKTRRAGGASKYARYFSGTLASLLFTAPVPLERAVAGAGESAIS